MNGERKTNREEQKHGKQGQETGSVHRRTVLFQRVRDGEPDLFSALADELADLLHRRLRVDTRTRALAWNQADMDDVLQHTFLRLWERRDRFDPLRGTIDGLAWIIARNAAVSVLRLRSRKSAALIDRLEDRRAAKPESGLLAAEEQQAFTEALQQVKDPMARRALELRLVVGLTYAAASRETGVPLGTIGGWVHKFRRSLRAA